jgi:hypothetical protein
VDDEDEEETELFANGSTASTRMSALNRDKSMTPKSVLKADLSGK